MRRSRPLPAHGPCRTRHGVPPRPVVGSPAGLKENVPHSRHQAALTAEVTAHRVERARRQAREDRERARRAAEEAGPQGRPENAILGSETCHLQGSEHKTQRVGQGCCSGNVSNRAEKSQLRGAKAGWTTTTMQTSTSVQLQG